MDYTCDYGRESSYSYSFADWARHDPPEHVRKLAKYIPLARKAKTLAQVKALSGQCGISVEKLMMIGNFKIKNNRVVTF